MSLHLQIDESKEAGVYVAGLQEDIVTSPEHVLQLLEHTEMQAQLKRSCICRPMRARRPACTWQGCRRTS